MKKTILTTLASIMALTMMLPFASVAMAQPDLTAEAVSAVRPALHIQAPESAKVGQSLKIRVITRPDERPVSRAEVWAININDISNETSSSQDYASLAERCGHFLGWTNNRGYVDPLPRIWREGGYVLVAIKPYFIPGVTKIRIEPLTPLTLRAPDTARIGQIVTMQVTEPIHKPVPRAAMFAIPLRNVTDEADQTKTYDQLLKNAQTYVELLADSDSKLAQDVESYAELNGIRRYFIGFTDLNGEKTHRFWRIGPHLLITAKWGYIPDCKIIHIKGLQQASVEPLLMRVETYRLTTI